jgi:ABC-type bacteriocin/lantibiotic exporters, contain an N-terminal double-glycine peptidase domain
LLTGHPLGELPAESRHVYPDEPAITAEGLWFKYEKELPDVVKGLSLTVRRGEFLALLGGNGTGKTTSLKLLSGLQKPYRGEVKLVGRVGVLPQNPQVLFVKKSVTGVPH